MQKIFLLLILFIALVVVGFLHTYFKNFNSPLAVINGKKINIELAKTTEEKTKGLSGRENLPEDAGMLFLFSAPRIQNFWMKEMRFPIDIVWLKNDEVVGFAENARPPATESENPEIYSSPEEAEKVLEINAGKIKEWNIKVGDRLIFYNITF